MGLAATGLGINAVVQNMPDSVYPVLFIASLAAGSLIGNMLKIDERVSRLTARRGNPEEGLEKAWLQALCCTA